MMLSSLVLGFLLLISQDLVGASHIRPIHPIHPRSDPRGPTWSARDNISFTPDYEQLPTRHAHNLTYPSMEGWADWRKFKAKGVNLGGWFLQEITVDEDWWNSLAPNATDEWTLCETLGTRCGPVLEERYATWITTSDIDQLAAHGVNTIRIPTSYSAWVNVPGSKLYHGNQQSYLKTITDYAIETYDMHVILGLHNLPGGVNGLEIGEAVGHTAWFGNETNLQWSYKAVEEVLNWMQASGHLSSFTFYPINEPANQPQYFASAAGLNSYGTEWLKKYFQGCLQRIARIDKRIPLMLQDGFQGEHFWSQHFESEANIVIDTHVYFFAAPNATSENVPRALCDKVPAASGDGRFPVFIGEFALESTLRNTLASRKTLIDTWLHVTSKYLQGCAFWSWKFTTATKVAGEGTLKNYWSFQDLINSEGVSNTLTNSYC